VTNCEDRNEALLDCALGAAPSAELENHLATCTRCSDALRSMRDSAVQMDQAVAQLVAVEPSLSVPSRPTSSRPSWLAWRWALAAAACVVVLLFAWPKRETLPDTSAISAWQSPTSSLLRSAADPLLREVPRLGEKFQEK